MSFLVPFSGSVAFLTNVIIARDLLFLPSKQVPADIIERLSEDIVGQSEQGKGKVEDDGGCYACFSTASFLALLRSCPQLFITLLYPFLPSFFAFLTDEPSQHHRKLINASRARSVCSGALCPPSVITIRDEGEQDGECTPLMGGGSLQSQNGRGG
ncbi:hypothetical protein DFH08DRAFT_971460 [Mycena albidolilacea]|uniref:Uncharacterized protein n=1 Tax=Mycena albidolilacea TaxID=1033008 RepID=A0AAD7EF32_9AGAR|nr:hypothetical protein DFH08DRAFT_971460 [Mycena albidolilacea]